MDKQIHVVKNLLLIFLLTVGSTAFGQNYLSQPIKISSDKITLEEILQEIGRQGNFYFSYSSGIIPSDSLLTHIRLEGDAQTVLHQLLGNSYEYRQSPKHVIIRPAPFRLTLMPEEVGENRHVHIIKGYVVDEKTGKGIYQASVYEKRLLMGTMTNKKGHFKLKIKTRDNEPIVLTVSKALYKDTTTIFLPSVQIGENPSKHAYGYMDTDGESVSNTWFARVLLGSRQRLNALNLGNFFAYTPVQVSLTPGLSSHGIMSGQIVNKFSANLIGGYTAGVNGVEFAGIFNIDRYHVRYVQAAGLLNTVGGNLSGVQLAGVFNSVLDSLKGVQAAGILNLTKKQVNGLQMAGAINRTNKLHGAQIAGLINYAKNNSGLQFGIINMADTSSGVSIGLVNIIGNGFKRFSISTNEIQYVSLAFKSGNAKLYSIISAGLGAWNGIKIPVTGFGVGHEFNRHKKKSYFAAELIAQQLQGKDFDNVATWPKLSVLYNFSLNQRTKVFVAPSINLLVKNNQTVTNEKEILPKNYPLFVDHEKTKLWAGLAIGISFF